MPKNKSDKKASLIASIFLWHQSLIDLVTLGRTIDFYFPSFPHETEGDGLIFFSIFHVNRVPGLILQA